MSRQLREVRRALAPIDPRLETTRPPEKIAASPTIVERIGYRRQRLRSKIPTTK